MNLDLSNNYQYWINPIQLQLDGNGVDVAQIGEPSTDERSAFDGKYVGKDATFLIPESKGVPAVGSVIVYGGITYRALTAQYDHFDKVYSCYCLNLSIGLGDTITVERPTITFDAARAPIRTYAAVYTDIPAAVKLLGIGNNLDSGITGKQESYEIVVSQQLALQGEDRIVWSGKRLKIVNYVDSGRLDELPKIMAVKQT